MRNFLGPTEVLCILWRVLEGSNEEKMGEATERRGSRVKCRKALLEWSGVGMGYGVVGGL